MFLPQPEDLLVNLNDSYDLVTQMLDSFENYFLPKNGHPKTQESCFISALNTANTISKHIGGRMLMFQVSHASSRHALLAQQTAQPPDLSTKFTPTNPYFANTGTDFAHDQLSVDLYIFTHGKD